MELPQRDAKRVKQAIEKVMRDPRGQGTIKLEHAPVAQYRRRVGNWRILFDIDDAAQVIEIVDIRKRDEGTYR